MDRTAKALMLLVGLGIWCLVLRPLASAPAPVLAQDRDIAPPGLPAAASAEVVMMQHPDGIMVVTRGKISWWTTGYSGQPPKPTLFLRDSKVLP